MRNLMVTAFVSLDGVVQGPGGPDEDRDGGFAHGGWAVPHIDDEVISRAIGVAARADALLLGRRTYEEFAAFFAPQGDSDPMAAGMNAMPKVVVSTTLTDPAWENSTVDDGSDLPGLVARLKEQYDGDVLVAGSATLVEALRQHDLVDEYRLMVHPIVLGRGKRLFRDGSDATTLSVAETRMVGPDVQLVVYRPAGG